MRLGLDSYSYHLHFGRHELKHDRPRDVWWFLNRVVELGLEGFQIDPWHMPEGDASVVERIARFAVERGLYIESGVCGVEPATIREGLETARRLGAKTLRCFVGESKGSARTQTLAAAAEKLKSVAGDAERAGVVVAVENHGDYTGVELAGMLARVGHPFVGACLDAGNDLMLGPDVLEGARAMAPFAACCHFKDWIVDRLPGGKFRITATPMGEGQVPLREVFGILRGTKARNITLEMHVPPIGPVAESLAHEYRIVRESVRFVRGELLPRER